MSDEDLKSLQRQVATLSAGIAKLSGDAQIPTFAEFAQEYLREKMMRPLREATKRSFENQVRLHLVPGFGGILIDRLTNALWLEWIEREQAKEGRRLTKFFNSRKSLIEILRSALDRGLIQKLPKFDDPDVYEPVGRVVEDAEMIRIFRRSRRPFRFIFYCFWAMGNRPREILRWEWSMIRWSEPGQTWIDIPARISKTKRTRSIPIDPVVSRILFRRFGNRGVSLFVFPSTTGPLKPQLTYQSAWDTATGHAKVDAVAYDMRRTRITKWAAAGKSLAFIARQLDTSETMIRRIYLKDDAATMEGLFK